jgi:type VI secretion system protein VasG
MKVVPFYPLRKETMKGIVKLKLAQIGKRLQDAHGMAFDYDPSVVDRVAERCTEIDTGARNIDSIIDRTLLPAVSKAMLMRMADQDLPGRLTLGMDEKGDFTYTFA